MNYLETILLVVGATALTLAVSIKLALYLATRDVAKLKVVRIDKSIAKQIVELMAKDGFLNPPQPGERPSSYLPKLLEYIKHLRANK